MTRTNTVIASARSRAAAAVLAALVAATVASCSSDDAADSSKSPSPSPSAAAEPSASARPQTGELCPDATEGGTQVRFGDDEYLSGVVLGTGKVGVVLAHEYESDACNWLPYAQVLAKKGYTTLAFDFGGYGGSELPNGVQSNVDDVEQAAQYLRAHGATKIVLMGASMGAQAELIGAKDVEPEAVVSLSAPWTFQSFVVDPSTIKVPVLLMAGKDDSGGGFADNARLIYSRIAGTQKSLKIVDSAEHGTALLRSSVSTTVEGDIEAFLAKYAPAKG